MDAGSCIVKTVRLRITLKYTTLVRMRIGPFEPAWHDNGAEVTNGLQ